jgi:hypothetical protein
MSSRRAPSAWSSLFSPARSASRSAPRKPLRQRTLRLESLEARTVLSTTPVVVNIPTDINPTDVYLQVAAVLTAPYTNSANTQLATGAVVYYDNTISDYALASPTGSYGFQITTNGQAVDLPNTPVKGGFIAIGIGGPPVATYTTDGISTPTAATNPTTIFGLFEYAYDGNGLDVDLSEIDQVGFPFTITTTPAAPVPAESGVGMTPTRAELFALYTDYITSQGETAALFQDSLTEGQPYRILAPQNLLTTAANLPLLQAANYSAGGSLTIGTDYYYFVTATTATGETAPSAYTKAVPFNNSYRGINYPQQTVVLNWSSVEGATGYNVYRSLGTVASAAQYIGSWTPGSAPFSDNGLTPQAKNPPSNSYTFNPLNSYFNEAIDDFFAEYAATNSFQIERDGYLFQGEVGNWTDPATSYTYQVLNLSPTTGPYTSQEFLIFKPYFSTNTNIAGTLPPPSWMPHPEQSPAAMILAADGVFNTGGYQPNVDAGTLSDLQNSVVSAFNRGIANNFLLSPSNWANEPSLLSAQAIDSTIPNTNLLAPNTTYYYVMTAYNADGLTTTSLERMVTTTNTAKSVLLTFEPQSEPTQYYIFRSTTQGGGYQFVGAPVNPANDNITTFLDAGLAPSSTTPSVYYAPGTMSNWYSAFFHQNSTNNPTSGVSINGLAYGFAYDDQGGSSTNFQGFFTQVNINIGS